MPSVCMKRLSALMMALLLLVVPTFAAQAQPEKGVESPSSQNAPITIKSPSAVLMESRSGRVLYQKNGHERRNPASVTKIMTLIVAFDAIRAGKAAMNDQVTISEEAAKQIGTIIFADAGERFRLSDLLRSIAVGSANDAAVAVAEHISGSTEAFVQEMNAKAKALGMHDSHFRNPTGLTAADHLMSAYDIALMSRYAANQYPQLMQLTSVYGADLPVPWRKNGPTFRLWNNNKLLTWYQGADGLKTGWTEAAGYCLAATAVRQNVRMISVIMGAGNGPLRNAEAARLLDYGFSNYTALDLIPRDSKVGVVRVIGGGAPFVAATVREPFAVSVRKEERASVKQEVHLHGAISAPVQAGQVIGEVIATVNNQEVGRTHLVADGPVPRANLWQRLLRHVGRVFTFEYQK